MFTNLWNKILDWFDQRNDRSNLIRSFNKSAQDAYVSGIVPTLLKAEISSGNRAYRHQFSAMMNTGFRIKVFSGASLDRNALISIASVILADDVLVRRMIVLGFDTFELYGEGASLGIRYQLKSFSNPILNAGN